MGDLFNDEDYGDLRSLTRRFAGVGRLEAIYLRPAHRTAAVRLEAADAMVDRGLEGDRAALNAPSKPGGSKRQVTLIQAEYLPVIAAFANVERVDAALLRRNLVISGLNLNAAATLFANQPMVLRIGEEVELAITGSCDPCSRMEQAIGRSGWLYEKTNAAASGGRAPRRSAMRGHFGATARVLRGGILRVGDAVTCVVAA